MGKHLYKIGKRKCYICKEIFPLTKKYFYRNSSMSMGLHTACKDCHKRQNLKYNKKPYSILKLDKQYIYKKYKHNAKDRGREWNLIFEEFIQFWQKPCYYCGENIDTIGLDRIDNLKGYSVDNILPCCSKCNYMKFKLDKNDFLQQCKKIYKYLNKKGQNNRVK